MAAIIRLTSELIGRAARHWGASATAIGSLFMGGPFKPMVRGPIANMSDQTDGGWASDGVP
jgi:hypothetical protein